MRNFSVMVKLGKAYDGVSLNNNDFMLVVPDPLNIGSIVVSAESAEDAKNRAVILLKNKGYENGSIAPEVGGAPIVMEL